jgi:hypothetical protein
MGTQRGPGKGIHGGPVWDLKGIPKELGNERQTKPGPGEKRKKEIRRPNQILGAPNKAPGIAGRDLKSVLRKLRIESQRGHHACRPLWGLGKRPQRELRRGR